MCPDFLRNKSRWNRCCFIQSSSAKNVFLLSHLMITCFQYPYVFWIIINKLRLWGKDLDYDKCLLFIGLHDEDNLTVAAQNNKQLVSYRKRKRGWSMANMISFIFPKQLHFFKALYTHNFNCYFSIKTWIQKIYNSNRQITEVVCKQSLEICTQNPDLVKIALRLLQRFQGFTSRASLAFTHRKLEFRV